MKKLVIRAACGLFVLGLVCGAVVWVLYATFCGGHPHGIC